MGSSTCGHCRHCNRILGRARSKRGLCIVCYRDDAIRVLYACCKTGPKPERHDDPTEEELNAIIAQQMRCLPAWWPDEELNPTE